MADSAAWAGKNMGGKKQNHSPANDLFVPFCHSLEIPRQDWQENGGRRIGTVGVPPSSFILHHSSFSPPTITLGPYTGDQLSVDHIIPFSVAPQLDHVIANLEFMPLRMNIGKRDKMGQRQQALAQRLRNAGLF